MLKAWVEILPLFVVRWLATRCGTMRTTWKYGQVERTFIIARPDIHIKVIDK